MWPPVSGEYNNFQEIFNKISDCKVDPVVKLQVISAVDSGQSKIDISKQYGVNPTTISYIYKQKEYLTKTYKEKLSSSVNHVRSINLDTLLVDWLKRETIEGNLISEEELTEKAEAFLGPACVEFPNIAEWVKGFQQRHNVVGISPVVGDIIESKDEWNNLINKYHEDNIYVGGTCGLWHSLDVDSFAEGTKPDNQLSIMMITNASGSDKKPLLVVGQDCLDLEAHSLPLRYYKQTHTSLVNLNTINEYLKEWNSQLELSNRTVALVLNISKNVRRHIKFSNIKILKLKNLKWISKTIDQFSHCLRFHYRRKQVTDRILYPSASNCLLLHKSLFLLGFAWHCLSVKFIRHSLYPLSTGCLILVNENDKSKAIIKELSLSEWCKTATLPLELEEFQSRLDDFLICDRHLPSFYEVVEADNMLESVTSPGCSSVVDAYQAMRRLMIHLQGEPASTSVVQAAKTLENYVEFGLLYEIQGHVSEQSTK